MRQLASTLVKAERLFTRGEANGELPRLQMLMERLQRGALRLREEFLALAEHTQRPPEALTTEELVRERPAARMLVEDLDGIVQEVEASGAVLKDVQLGLVDFPAQHGGEVIYLCWQFGEPEVAFWHAVDEGFSGRQPLPGAASGRVLQ